MTGYNPDTRSIVEKLTVPTTCGDRIRLRYLRRNQRKKNQRLDKSYGNYKRLDDYGFIHYDETVASSDNLTQNKIIKNVSISELGEKYLIFFNSIFVNNIIPTYIAFFVMLLALTSLILQVLGVI